MSKAKNKGKQTPGVQKRFSLASLVPGKSEITWIIEPHDPLIVRDGRPFGPNPSARAISLSFPFPSTTTGGVRSRAGLRSDGTFDTSQIERVKKIKVRGPLLVRLAQSGENIEEWLVPAPADALLLEWEKKGHVWRKPLVPLTLYQGAEFNNIHDSTSLMLIGPVRPNLRKPSVEGPPYWRWDAFEQWLMNPVEGEQPLATLGHRGPLHEHRLHVSMNPETLTAKTGALFETSGLEFASPGESLETRLRNAQRLALAVIVDRKEALRSGLASLGGERRMVSWRRSDSDLPECPPSLLTAIIKHKACRVLLLTPACFEHGYRPKWLVEPRDGVQPNLRAIAIQRPQVVSGWRLEHPAGPKPTRRLAPAGTVLFLSLAGDDKAIESWVKGRWMQCISDDEQDQKDGFGLAVFGSWSGKPEIMEEVKEAEDKLWGAAATKEDKRKDARNKEEQDKEQNKKEGRQPTVQIEVKIDKPGSDIDAYSVIEKTNRYGEIKYQVKEKRPVPLYAAFPLQPQQKDINDWNPSTDREKTVRDGVFFILTIIFPVEKKDEVEAALWAWETFGGIGARTRRGFGALRLLFIDGKGNTDLPDLNTQTPKAWIEGKLKKLVVSGTYPLGMPRLASSIQFTTTASSGDAKAIWNNLIDKLKSFRQNRQSTGNPNHPGRSIWPEPSEIRLFTDQSLPAHENPPIPDPPIRKFPRAAFGLPIIFQFKDRDRAYHDNKERDPRNTVLRLDISERLASPLILKPLACKNGKYVGLAVILDGTGVDEDRLILKTQEGTEKMDRVKYAFDPTESLVVGEDRLGNPIKIDSSTNALQAFLKYLEGI